MKKGIVILLIGITSILNAQPQSELTKKQAIESLKIAFLSRQLSLTPEEAQKFWPVYNQYDDEIKKLRKEHQLAKKDELAWQETMLNLNKRFKPEFLKCISQEKFDRLLTVNRDWRDMIRKELDRRKQMHQQMKRNRQRSV